MHVLCFVSRPSYPSGPFSDDEENKPRDRAPIDRNELWLADCADRDNSDEVKEREREREGGESGETEPHSEQPLDAPGSSSVAADDLTMMMWAQRVPDAIF